MKIFKRRKEKRTRRNNKVYFSMWGNDPALEEKRLIAKQELEAMNVKKVA